MAQIYCGILGLLAFLTTLARGWIHGVNTEEILWDAWLSMLLFAFIGLIIGRTASFIVEDSVKTRFAAEMATAENNKTKSKTAKAQTETAT